MRKRHATASSIMILKHKVAIMFNFVSIKEDNETGVNL